MKAREEMLIILYWQIHAKELIVCSFSMMVSLFQLAPVSKADALALWRQEVFWAWRSCTWMKSILRGLHRLPFFHMKLYKRGLETIHTLCIRRCDTWSAADKQHANSPTKRTCPVEGGTTSVRRNVSMMYYVRRNVSMLYCALSEGIVAHSRK